MDQHFVKVPNFARVAYPNPMDLVQAAYGTYMSTHFKKVIGADGELKDAVHKPLTIKPVTQRGQLDLFEKTYSLPGIEDGTPGAFERWKTRGLLFHGTARYEEREGGLRIVVIDGAPVHFPRDSRDVFLSDVVREFVQK